MKRKVIAAVLCIAMTASGSVFAMAADGEAPAAGGSAVQTAAAFSDVSENSWYAAAVKYVNDKGLFSGTAADRFSPNINMSRGMFVTVLGRAAGVTPTDSASGFSDVSADKYYAPYVKWASDNKIVTGTGNGRFSPDADVSREQMCSIIVRFLRDYKKLDLSKYSADSAIFADASSISSWAKADVIIAQRLGIIEGSVVNGDQLRFDPAGKTTRAAAAAVFQRLDAVIKGLEGGTAPDPVTPAQPDNGSGSGTAGGSTGGGTSGGSTGGNTGSDTGKDDGKHTDEEIAEESEVAGYLVNMSAKYKKAADSISASKPVKQAMDLLMDTIDRILADRENGAFISSEYVKTNYRTEIDEFRSMYNSLTDSQNDEMQNIAIRLETEAHIYYVLDYFGVKQADI